MSELIAVTNKENHFLSQPSLHIEQYFKHRVGIIDIKTMNHISMLYFGGVVKGPPLSSPLFHLNRPATNSRLT